MNREEKDITKPFIYAVLLMTVLVFAMVYIAVLNIRKMDDQMKERRKISLDSLVSAELTQSGKRLISRYKKYQDMEIKDNIKMPLYELAAILGPFMAGSIENELLKNNILISEE